ncbi:unnamed protein product [Echinostoma caproni]|uniref:Reverse transcriptase domain-containing protein n=1 Tax=Echinostoma caproni TaxID=27848 RepID=A0A183ALQ4_9TREM|nr:unnamed protein product [Echinostoma caproni]
MLTGIDGAAYYRDDIIVTGMTPTELSQRLHRVLTRIQEFGLHLHLKKGKSLMPSVKYLGFIIDRHGCPFNIAIIDKIPPPHDVNFVGGAYNQQFCKPADSPEQPPRRFPMKDVLSAFDRILNATNVINEARSRLTRSEKPGKYYKNVTEVLLGIQLDALGEENFAQVLPALDVAIEKIKKNPDFNGVQFTTVPILHISSIACDSLAVLHKFETRAINVLLGPLNDFSIANAARFSNSMYNVPVVTPGGFAYQLKDKVEYALLTRVFFSYSDLPWLIENTMKQYGWLPNEQTPIGLYAARKSRLLDEGTGHTALVGVFQQQSINAYLLDNGYKVFHILTEDETGVVDQFLRRLPDTARSEFYSIYMC